MANSKIMGVLKKYAMAIILVLVILLFYVLTDKAILIPQNINNLLSQNAYVFVLGTGMLLCILTGGNIDLAVGSVVCFAGAVGGVVLDKDVNIVFAFIIMLLIGLLIGMWQGFWIAFVNVPPFIATLAGMYAFRGLSNVVLKGQAMSLTKEVAFLNTFGGGAECYIPDFFHGESINLTCMAVGIIGVIVFVVMTLYGRINTKKRGYETAPFIMDLMKMAVISFVVLYLTYKLAKYKGIPTSLIWVLLVVLIFGYVTQKTVIGRDLYAVGGNKKAAQLSGVNLKKIYFFAYSFMGLLAGLAGTLTIARFQGAQPTFGQGYEMDAIGACFIGGASAYGGIGTVPGVIIGALLTGVINQGMVLCSVDANLQKVVKGLVLLGAVVFDVLSKKEKK
ncbi:MAG: sugar ABC transporter permease [Lachnospiraceae bacterium]|nr:sugar ABC transporter permease [Lachnospiraceae bacterium]